MTIEKIVNLKTKTNIIISFDKKEVIRDEFNVEVLSKDFLHKKQIAFRLLNGDFNPLRKTIVLNSDEVSVFVKKYEDLLNELANSL